ncbi:MAG TPA: hypothetical protein VE981_22695 [Planctomycetota bacterium]|nr:hypothetical protein [Planctomycetota bacterium]
MTRAMVAVAMTGAALLGFSLEAHAQSLVAPCGPMAVKEMVATPVLESIEKCLTNDYFYPGRTMGGGTRILRSSPPPSFLKRRKE